jgi:hypothetical protein
VRRNGILEHVREKWEVPGPFGCSSRIEGEGSESSVLGKEGTGRMDLLHIGFLEKECAREVSWAYCHGGCGCGAGGGILRERHCAVVLKRWR